MELDKRIALEAEELARQFWAEVEAAFDAEIARIRASLSTHATPLAHRPRDDEISTVAHARYDILYSSSRSAPTVHLGVVFEKEPSK